jgi:phosphoglycolate phosphatase-like HAD superfamily hydrolase
MSDNQLIKTILCWDIDGTLLSTARAGIAAWEGSFLAFSGKYLSLDEYPTAGLTDVEIATALAKECGESSSAVIQQLLCGYEDRLADCLPTRRGYVMPGIIDILNQLQTMPYVYSMLLTGNTARGAKAKLSHYGLAEYFQGGAFSDNFSDRISIAEHAVKIVEQHLGYADQKQFFIIGDTPHDIHCANAIKAKTLAVCTGNYDKNALAQYNPWLIMESLDDTKHFFQALGL